LNEDGHATRSDALDLLPHGNHCRRSAKYDSLRGQLFDPWRVCTSGDSSFSHVSA